MSGLQGQAHAAFSAQHVAVIVVIGLRAPAPYTLSQVSL